MTHGTCDKVSLVYTWCCTREFLTLYYYCIVILSSSTFRETNHAVVVGYVGHHPNYHTVVVCGASLGDRDSKRS